MRTLLPISAAVLLLSCGFLVWSILRVRDEPLFRERDPVPTNPGEATSRDESPVAPERFGLLRVRLVNWPDGEEGEGGAVLPDGSRTRPAAVVDGTLTVRGLRRGEKAVVWVRNSASTRGAFLPDLEVGDHEAVVGALGTITGRIDAPEGATRLRAEISLYGRPFRVDADADGRFTIRYLPAGEWRVEAGGRFDGRELRGAADLRTGVPGVIPVRRVTR